MKNYLWYKIFVDENKKTKKLGDEIGERTRKGFLIPVELAVEP